MFLNRIIEKKREEVEALKRARPLAEVKRAIADRPPALDFRGALAGRECAIIAEVKRSSPSRGRMVEDFRPVETARLYERSGAAAVSVLTEKNFFEGSGEYLSEIKQAVKLPILRKDFIIDPYQIYETRGLGGDALLLIAGLLDEDRLRDFIAAAAELGLDQLVEVHTRADLDRALAAGAGVIGINNRDLQTFSTDLQTTLDLLPFIPGGRLVVSESGIRSRPDVDMLTHRGVHAFLIGEELVRSGDIRKKMAELLGHARD